MRWTAISDATVLQENSQHYHDFHRTTLAEMRYRLLGSSAIRVSEVALGTMTFGERWGWGAPLEESRRMLDLFLDQGGNFVDTACNYTDGESEEQLGELLEGRRERVVLATKYALTPHPDDPNSGGNHRKSVRESA